MPAGNINDVLSHIGKIQAATDRAAAGAAQLAADAAPSPASSPPAAGKGGQ